MKLDASLSEGSRQFLGISFSVEILGSKGLGKPKRYNQDLGRINFSFKFVIGRGYLLMKNVFIKWILVYTLRETKLHGKYYIILIFSLIWSNPTFAIDSAVYCSPDLLTTSKSLGVKKLFKSDDQQNFGKHAIWINVRFLNKNNTSNFQRKRGKNRFHHHLIIWSLTLWGQFSA